MDKENKYLNNRDYPESKLTEVIIGSAFKVFNELGYGLSEKMYQRALCKELKKHNFYIQKEKYGLIKYEGEIIGRYYIDLIVNKKVAVEMKVRREIYQKDINQLLNYIKSENLPVGLLLAFSKEGVNIKRLINNNQS